MAEQQITELPPYVVSLLSAFEHRFPGSSTEVERIRASGMDYYRIGLVSDLFDGVSMMKRQDIVWDLASSTVDRDAFLHISMIVTMTPDELHGEE